MIIMVTEINQNITLPPLMLISLLKDCTIGCDRIQSEMFEQILSENKFIKNTQEWIAL